MYYLQETIWWLNKHTVNWNLVYLAELLVVMTDRLKIVRIHARSVPRVHGDKRFDDDASLTSLHQESDGVATVACSMRRGAGLLKHKNILSGQLAPVW